MSIDITSELAALADPTYQAFQAKLVPTVDPARILGVRIPALRRYARSLARSHPDEAHTFLENPAHGLYEEMNLHAELIGIMSRTPQEAFELLDPFLPYVDNWATCDLIRVPAFQHDLPAVLDRITAWTAATGPHSEYVVRFGVVQLMELFLGDAFDPAQLEIVARIDRDEYYINMARAWYFSCALIKQPSSMLPLFEARPPRLDVWTHNKALQKARESRRVSPEQKARLQELKIKGA